MYFFGNTWLNVSLASRHKHTKPPKNCSHKYNIFTITFFVNVWTSHFGLFLLVLSIFDCLET